MFRKILSYSLLSLRETQFRQPESDHQASRAAHRLASGSLKMLPISLPPPVHLVCLCLTLSHFTFWKKKKKVSYLPPRNSDTVWQLFYCELCPFLPEHSFLFGGFHFMLFNVYFWVHGMWDLSSLMRDRTLAPCSGSMESSPLDLQGSPRVAASVFPSQSYPK